MPESKNKIDTLPNNLGYGPDRLGQVMDQLLDLFAERVIGPNSSENDTIDISEIHAALTAFKSRADIEIQTLITQGWENLSKASEEVYWARMRTHPLERLMVRNFAHLLAPYGESPIQNVSLSRRIIPAFMGVLSRMVGPELMATYQKRAKELVERQKEISGDVFDWTTLYDTPSAQAIINDILIYIAQYFADVEQRRIWMVDFFNRTMPKAKNEAEENWHFDDVTFIQFITALYANLFAEMEIPQSFEELQKRYGQYNIDTLKRMHQAIQIDSQKVFTIQTNEMNADV
ncbi:hypothetical protein [Curvivirga aplysinae]|uniref:hypothetical protein n=1 Tax=Curvivirga aplysinae TaxID=2529852 RepID=UPI0012BCB1C0|nr:hypothetical protein [Curvivirga aplysinae]MTI09257.1 hypothetical protein [Curvivirga aplysinae]